MASIKKIDHDIEGFKYTISENRIVVEGLESGVLDNNKIFSDNRFCSVFEIEGNLIVRMYVYTDVGFMRD